MFPQNHKKIHFSANDYRVVFMGTPEFSVLSLRALKKAGYDIVSAITQPDRPAGRGYRLQPSHVARFAEENHIPVLKPEKLRESSCIEQIRLLKPDCIIVVAYGRIIPRQILAIPRYGCVNIHPSLLPEFRGPSPIQAALLQGKKTTGISIMLLDDGMDSGPILTQESIKIQTNDNAGSLHDRLSSVGAGLLMQTLPLYLQGKIKPQKQSESLATFTKKIDNTSGKIDWTRDSYKIYSHIRAYTPWPGAFTVRIKKKKNNTIQETIKIISARPKKGAHWRSEKIAFIRQNKKGELEVLCGRGSLVIDEVQLMGKKAMSAKDFLRGSRDFIGNYLL